MGELSTQTKIKRERTRLSKVIDDLPDDKKTVAKGLIDQLAFIAVTLNSLQEEIIAMGATQAYDNGGGQSGQRISPAAQLYTKLVANYNALSKQLVALFPAGEGRANAKTALDPMVAFLNS